MDFLWKNKHNNPLVTCYYCLQPWGRAGDSRENVSCFHFCIVPTVLGTFRGFDFSRQTWQVCCGFTNWLSLQYGGYSRKLLVEKPKALLFPRAGAVVTNDWHITIINICIFYLPLIMWFEKLTKQLVKFSVHYFIENFSA